MSMTASTIASSERRLLVGLGVTGQSVARWWRQQGVVFGAIDTRAEMADDPSVFADIDRSKVTFGEVEAAFADDYTEMIVSPWCGAGSPVGSACPGPRMSRARGY